MWRVCLSLLVYFVKQTGSCASTTSASPAVTTTTSSTTTTTTTTTSTTTTTTSLSCMTAGYMLFETDCYMLITTATDAQTAQTNCQAMGGFIAVAHSTAQNTFLQTLSGGATIWLGYLKLPPATTFMVADGGAFDFNNWAAGQPGTALTDNCVTMNGANGQWTAGNCLGVNNEYICEIPATVNG